MLLLAPIGPHARHTLQGANYEENRDGDGIHGGGGASEEVCLTVICFGWKGILNL